MSDNFDDTIECIQCGNENAYFNGNSYECPECGFEWNGDLDFDNKFELDEDENRRRYFKNQEISFIGKTININSVIKLFSPEWKFYKWNELYKETGSEEDYYDELTEVLLDSNNYESILKIKSPKNLTNTKKHEIMTNVVSNYLESRNELPLFPTIQDWSKYINAPEDFINEIIPKKEVNYRQFLPLVSDFEDFTVLFYNKIKKFYEEISNDENEPFDEVSLDDLENIFTSLVHEEKPMIDDDYRLYIANKLKKYCDKEFKIIKRYREDLNKEDSFDKYTSVAKEKHLTLIETIALILKDYLKEIMI